MRHEVVVCCITDSGFDLAIFFPEVPSISYAHTYRSSILYHTRYHKRSTARRWHLWYGARPTPAGRKLSIIRKQNVPGISYKLRQISIYENVWCVPQVRIIIVLPYSPAESMVPPAPAPRALVSRMPRYSALAALPCTWWFTMIYLCDPLLLFLLLFLFGFLFTFVLASLGPFVCSLLCPLYRPRPTSSKSDGYFFVRSQLSVSTYPLLAFLPSIWSSCDVLM